MQLQSCHVVDILMSSLLDMKRIVYIKPVFLLLSPKDTCAEATQHTNDPYNGTHWEAVKYVHRTIVKDFFKPCFEPIKQSFEPNKHPQVL